jgi:carboxymethylenebutenolidase
MEERVMGEMISFAANGGTCSGYLAPASEGRPGVVVIQEWWGINANIKGIADRFAAAGYTALAPDLFHGIVTTEPDEAGKLAMSLRIEEAAKDLHGAITHLRSLTGHTVGVVGFCMGGALSLYSACANPADVAACVDFYGGHPAVHPDLASLAAPVLGLFGEKDHGVTPEAVNQLDKDLTALGKQHVFTTYPGADHAFFNDRRPEVDQPEASQDAWQKVLAFFGESLG